MALFVGLIGWLCGLALGQWVGIPLEYILGLLALPLAAAALSRTKRVVFAALLILGLLLGLARVGLFDSDLNTSPLRDYVGQNVTLVGRVQEKPVPSTDLWRVHVDVEKIETSVEAVDLSDGAVVWLRSEDAEGITVGDTLALSGDLELPPTFPDFDYRSVLEREGISVALFRPEVELLRRDTGPSRWLTSLRGRLSDSLSRNLAEPQSSLARAILLGERDGLSPELRTEWSRAGTAHLLSISGLHVGVVLGVSLAAGLVLLGRRGSLYLLIPLATVWAYAALAGFGAPVQRAAIMASLYLLAISLGRQSSGGLILLFAAAVMAGLTPSALGEASFQLSFAAMAGLIYASPFLEALLIRITGPLELHGGVTRFLMVGATASLGAVIGVMPLLGYHFGATSLLSVPATLLALPILPLMLVSTALTAIAGVGGDLPGQVTGWLAWPWLTSLLALSTAFADAPFAALSFSPLSSVSVIVVYVVLLLVFWPPLLARPAGLLGPIVLGPGVASVSTSLRSLATSPPLLIGLALLALFLAAAVAFGDRDEDLLRVSFLDVGQGDAILVQAPGGRRLLIDGGPDPRLLEQRLSEELPWWSRRIDLVLLTHPNADHQSGLVDLLDRRSVGAVVDPMLPADTDLDARWRDTLSDNGYLVARAVEGMRIDLGSGVSAEVLHPPERLLRGTPSDLDNNAVVLRIVYGRASFLLPSDIFALAETYLVDADAPLQATVLKVPHHGSANASSTTFLEAAAPMIAVVSAGVDNRFNHPAPDALERIRAWVEQDLIFRTDRDGTIEMRTDGDRLWVETQ